MALDVGADEVRGVSVRELARHCGVAESYVRKIVSGDDEVRTSAHSTPSTTTVPTPIAFTRLRELPPEQGGVKPKMGRPKKGEGNGGSGPTNSKARDEAARVLGIGTDEARALESVFTTPGVPAELKAAVERDRIAPC